MRFLMLLVLSFCFFTAAHVNGQAKSYARDSVDASFKDLDAKEVGNGGLKNRTLLAKNALHQLEQDFRKILRGDLDYTQNQNTLDKFLAGYFLPRITHYDDTKIKFGEDRDRLIRQYLGNARQNDARDYVLDRLIFPYCKKICEGNYHPCSQINAMSLIAALNRREATKGVQPVPLVPMTQALDYMIATIDAAGRPLHLKIVAMQGIERHTEIDRLLKNHRINATSHQGIRDRMLTILDQTYTGQKSKDDAIYFQQRIATRVLGNLGDPGTGNAVAKKLAGLIANKNLRNWLRNDAIAAFSKLNFGQHAETQHLVKQMVNDSLEFLAEKSKQLAVDVQDYSRWVQENAIIYTGKRPQKLSNKSSQQNLDNPGISDPNEGEFQRQNTDPNQQRSKTRNSFEIPNYQINLKRQEIKLLLNTLVVAMAGEDRRKPAGMSLVLTDKNKSEILQIAQQLRLEIGKISDAPVRSTKLDKTRTQRLYAQLQSTSKQLLQLRIPTGPKPRSGESKRAPVP